ncbi:hypothetical protein HK097_004780 [Rhizophlyctis rosea]|uniref:Uncharacterized protein n=1 Tax=Rhizophlyctis rosea TaxID=64517 RepID=A0AAD5S157_9FUNG|nr:hypothetical protein HK097_004780 [Rhizophlyctis rosea]
MPMDLENEEDGDGTDEETATSEDGNDKKENEDADEDGSDGIEPDEDTEAQEDEKGFLKEDFKSWTLRPGGPHALHFFPSQYSYLTGPLSEFLSPSIGNDAYTLYWDLSYLQLMLGTLCVYDLTPDGTNEEKLLPFILKCDDADDVETVICGLNFDEKVWEVDGKEAEEMTFKEDKSAGAGTR